MASVSWVVGLGLGKAMMGCDNGWGVVWEGREGGCWPVGRRREGGQGSSWLAGRAAQTTGLSCRARESAESPQSEASS